MIASNEIRKMASADSCRRSTVGAAGGAARKRGEKDSFFKAVRFVAGAF